MGMGQELRDFTQGFQTGFHLRDQSKNRAERQLDREGLRNPADLAERNRILNQSGSADSGSPTRAPQIGDTSGAGVRSDGASANSGDPEADRVLNAIRPLEGGTKDPYNTGFGGKHIDLANMTVDEVLKNGYQGLKFPVLGAYQFKNSTLNGLVEKGYVDGSQKMTPELQDQMALQLMKGRGWEEYKAGKMTPDQFMGNMSQEWASLPDPAKGGASHYGGNGVDKAGISTNAFKSVLLGNGGSTQNPQVASAAAAPQTAIPPRPVPPDQAIQNAQNVQTQVDAGAVVDPASLPPPQVTSGVPNASQYDPNGPYGQGSPYSPYGQYTDQSQGYADGGTVTPQTPSDANNQAGSGRTFTQAVTPMQGGTTTGIPAGANGWHPRMIGDAAPTNSAIVNPAAGAQQKFRDNLAAVQSQIAARNAAAAAKPAAAPVDNGPFSHNSYLQAQQRYNTSQPSSVNNGRGEPRSYLQPFEDESTWQTQQPGYKDWYTQTYGKPPPTGAFGGNATAINMGYGYEHGGVVKGYANGGSVSDPDYVGNPGGGPAPTDNPPDTHSYDGAGVPSGPALHEMDDSENARAQAARGSHPSRNPSTARGIPPRPGDPSELHSAAGSLPTPDDAGIKDQPKSAVPPKEANDKGAKDDKAQQQAAYKRLSDRDKAYTDLPDQPIGQPVNYNASAGQQQGPTPPSPGSEPGGTPTPPPTQGPPIPSPGAQPGGTPTPPAQQGPPIPPGGIPSRQAQGPSLPPIGQPVDYSTNPQNPPPPPEADGPPIPPAPPTQAAQQAQAPYGSGAGSATPAPGQIGTPNQTANPPAPPIQQDPSVVARAASPYSGVPPRPQQGPPIPAKPAGGTATAAALPETPPQPIVKPGKVANSRRPIVAPQETQESAAAGLGSLNKGLFASKQYVGVGPDQKANAESNANTAKFLTNQSALTGQEYNQVAQQVDPQNKLAPAERILKVQQDLYDFYMARGYPDKAAAAAGSVLMYGRKVSQIAGSMAQAALEKGDSNTAAQWMSKAYETMPDGKELRIGQADAQGNVQYQLVDLHTGEAGDVQTATPQDLQTMAQQMSNGSEWARQTIGIAQGSGIGVNAGGGYGSSRYGGGRGRYGQSASIQNSQQRQGLMQGMKEAGDAYKKNPNDQTKAAFDSAANDAIAGGAAPGAVKAMQSSYGVGVKGAKAPAGTAGERKTAADDAALKEKLKNVTDPGEKAALTADDGFNRALTGARRVGGTKGVDGALEGTQLDQPTKDMISHYVPDAVRANNKEPPDVAKALAAIVAGAKVTMNGPEVNIEGYGNYYLSAQMLKDLAKARQQYKPAAANAG